MTKEGEKGSERPALLLAVTPTRSHASQEGHLLCVCVNHCSKLTNHTLYLYNKLLCTISLIMCNVLRVMFSLLPTAHNTDSSPHNRNT